MSSDRRLRVLVLIGLVVVASVLAAWVYWRIGWRDVTVSITTASPQTPARFDLVCSGFETVGPLKVIAFEQRVRIDLEEGWFCEGECVAAMQMGEASPNELLLHSMSGRHTNYLTVSREGGSRLRLTDYFGSNHDRTGICRPAPFSGLPEWPHPGGRPTNDLRSTANWSRYPAPEVLAASYPASRRMLGIDTTVRWRCKVDVSGRLVNCQPGSVAMPVDAFAKGLPAHFQMARRLWPEDRSYGATVDLTINFKTSLARLNDD